MVPPPSPPPQEATTTTSAAVVRVRVRSGAVLLDRDIRLPQGWEATGGLHKLRDMRWQMGETRRKAVLVGVSSRGIFRQQFRSKFKSKSK